MKSSIHLAFARNLSTLFACLVLINTFLPSTGYAQSGFADIFAPANWSYGENPGGQNMINTRKAPDAITISNYSAWGVSGAGMSFNRPHLAGKVTFTYTITGPSQPGCPASYMVGTDVIILPQTGSKMSFDVKQDQSFGFALNGQNQSENFGCKGAGNQNVAFTISGFSFDSSAPPPPTTITTVIQSVTSPTTNNLTGIARKPNGRLVAVGSSGTTIYSDDGTSWTANSQILNGPNLQAVAATGTMFVAVGASTAPQSNLFSSSDGTSWNGDYREPSSAWRGVTYPTSGSGYFLAIGGTSIWNEATKTQVYTGYALERGSAVGNDWLNRYTISAMALNSVAWNSNNVIVAVGTNGVARSIGGTSWTSYPKPVTYPLQDVTWGRSQFIAVGVGGGIATSPDGITWTSRTSGTTTNLQGVACSDTWCVAVGTGVVLTTTDGITWTSQTGLPTPNGFVHVTWMTNKFIAVGTGGGIWTIASQ